MGLPKHCFTANVLLRKVRWLQSEEDKPAVKISYVIAVLSLPMQPYPKIRTDYAKWIAGKYLRWAVCSTFWPSALLRQMRETFWVLTYSVRPLTYEGQSFRSAIDSLAKNRSR